jgi:hypothetical protein
MENNNYIVLTYVKSYNVIAIYYVNGIYDGFEIMDIDVQLKADD